MGLDKIIEKCRIFVPCISFDLPDKIDYLLINSFLDGDFWIPCRESA